MTKKKLLLLDDDPRVCDILSQGLSQEFEVMTTDDCDIAYRVAVKNPPDILLLDIQLKAGNGIDLCEKFRSNPLTKKIPILIFTGHGSTDNMLKSYDVGADDYLEKPIDLVVIRKRLHSRLKRVQDLCNDGLAFGNLKLFEERLEIELDGKTHKLSNIEFDLLRIFLTNPNKNISREEILKTLWSDIQVTERTVDVHISSLRRKLKDFNHNIKALYGSGYILKPSSKGVQDDI